MADDDRIPCKVCDRKFNPDVLARHEKICKITIKPRKVFDSSKQRAVEGEISMRQIKQAKKKELPPPKNHWREKHKDFINAIRSAKGVDKALKSGGPLPPPPPPSINPGYVQCPYCSRRFNEKAADRHIDFCKEQSMRLPKGKPDPAAKAKQNTRLNYQPPKLKAKAAPQPAAQPPAPSGMGRASRGGAGAGTRGTAPRGRTGPPAGRYAQEDVFSVTGHGVNSPVDTPPTSSRFNLNSQRHSTQFHQNHHSKQPATSDQKTCVPFHQNHHSKQPATSDQKTDIPFQRTLPTDDEPSYDYERYLDSYQDFPSDQLSSFPNHFNQRYKNNSLSNANHSSSSYSKNGSPSNFQYLSSIEMEEPYDEDMFLYSKESSSVTLYGNSKQSKLSSMPQRAKGASEVQSMSNKKVLLSYCQECGAKYLVAEAKFCCECGQRRPEGKDFNPSKYGSRYSRLK